MFKQLLWKRKAYGRAINCPKPEAIPFPDRTFLVENVEKPLIKVKEGFKLDFFSGLTERLGRHFPHCNDSPPGNIEKTVEFGLECALEKVDVIKNDDRERENSFARKMLGLFRV